MSWELLSRFIDSEHFNKDPSLTVAYLARYANHVGIHYVLCSKLRQFPYDEIEFFLPQLCHLLISIDNESMALEEFILDLCEESVNAALLTFWLLQTYLHDLSATPASESFQTCRRLYNWVQSLVFGGIQPLRRTRIQDNVMPVVVLSSLILSSIAVPFLPRIAGPLAIAQARRPRPVEDVLSDVPTADTSLVRSNSVDSGSIRARRHKSAAALPKRRLQSGTHAVQDKEATGDLVEGNQRRHHPSHRKLLAVTNDGFASTSSLPDQRAQAALGSASLDLPRRPADLSRRHSHVAKAPPGAVLTRDQQIRALRQHYFRSEMQFLSALEGIAARLISVPKAARLSALRAELVLIARDLPAEVDVPLICPVTLTDGVASKSRHHRVVRLNPAEATSLNSAEKVPYLLILEVLREDLDFDPDTDQNRQLLAKLNTQDDKQHRRLFDTSDATRREALNEVRQSEEENDSVFEPAKGDLSSPALLQDPDETPFAPKSLTSSPRLRSARDLPPRLSSGVTTLASSGSNNTMNEIDIDGLSGPSSQRASPYLKPQPTDQMEYSALAVHMRTAAQMLAQLESSTQKRPKAEVAAIKARIIASMQTMEEQNFNVDEALPAPSFEAIMARAGHTTSNSTVPDINDEQLDNGIDSAAASGRGAARMENDLKTGGVQRKGDRDDPSAAMFGEAWEQKKERIRRSSPYGWIKNWDLVSVIVKTGDDLRQEAFACQLITTCSKIWHEYDVDVWVKNMRILVTGESSGLIETITNAVSLHSLKRSLTLASIAAGTNPKKRIATLLDHYTKTFGAVDTPGYARAIENFVKSLAAYSMICYVLQLKDRHNGNILIDSEGHVVHIDFGFMLSNSPGNMGFEAAPFKLTMEYVELLGGVDGQAFAQFKSLMKDAFQALRREAERIITMVELMGKDSKMAAYGSGLTSVVAALRARFVLEKSQEEARDVIDELVGKSVGSYYTRLYDTYQYRTQGIY